MSSNVTFEEYQLRVEAEQPVLESVLLLKRTFDPAEIAQVFGLVLTKNEAQTQQVDT